MKHALTLLALAASLTGVGVLPARAQVTSHEAIVLNNQIAELRHEVQQLRDRAGQPATGQPPSSLGGYGAAAPAAGGGGSDLSVQLLDRVTSLEGQVRDLRGQVQEQGNIITQMKADLSKQIADLNFKVDGLAGTTPLTGAPAPAAGAAAPTGTATAAIPPAAVPAPLPGAHPTPEKRMQEGDAALARRDYKGAEKAAREVLAGKRGPLTTDANFLLAESLAGQQQWAKSAVAYDDTYTKAPHGKRAEDSLVGLAVSLANLNQAKAACGTLQKLHTAFPVVRADLRSTVAAVRKRSGCP